jgi:hypothetical protein
MRQAKFNCREQDNALIELFRSVYVFAKLPCDRLSVEMKLHSCREGDFSST